MYWDLHIIRTVASLRNMLSEMNRKGLEIGRITKTASILMITGTSSNSIPSSIIQQCQKEQRDDGGWKGVVDTMWNIRFLMDVNADIYRTEIEAGLQYLRDNSTDGLLWGRSRRDMNRIPVSGMLFFLLPVLADNRRLVALESLWCSEMNSLTYKAAYTLMAFAKNNFKPAHTRIVANTIGWLIDNQRDDGSFAPWKNHPAPSDVFCTGVALVGLSQFRELVPNAVFEKGQSWLRDTQLSQGIWPFHEIEDGSAWGLWALTEMNRANHESR